MKGRSLIIITSVIVLSFAGVGYSAWTQGLNINSVFATGNIQVIFTNPVVVNDELCEITVEADENVLNIYGTVSPGSGVAVKYDIYNDKDKGSSIPVKYLPCEKILPVGITLDQDDAIIEPGEYLEGNQLIILEPGENELILPFVQYNSSDSGGWREELKICWHIKVAEDSLEPELDMTSGNAITVEEPTGDVTVGEQANGDVTEAEPTEDAPEKESPPTDPASDIDPVPDTDSNDTGTEDNPVSETPLEEAPSDDNENNGNSNEESVQSEPPTETNDDSIVEDNTERDEGSEKNVEDGEE